MTAVEANFDGLVGPTHSYAGLAYGNLAATANALEVSNPREAALQGLAKMRRLAELGLVQGVLPPHERPHLPTLRALGFAGSDAAVLAAAWKQAPELVRNVSSASAMWTANAATVSPAADTADGRIHITPANLASMFHRSIEPEVTARVLRAVFPDGEQFAHHPPLMGGVHMGDEGAANHNRLSADYDQPGVELFVYGRRAFEAQDTAHTFPARQTLEASAAVARSHMLDPKRTLFMRQSRAAIDAGAFHNDVVAVTNLDVLFYHQQAFDSTREMWQELRAAAGDVELHFVEVPAAEVSLEDAVKSYLFNSQLVVLPGAGQDRRMALILPMEVQETPATRRYVDWLVADNSPITHAEYLDVRQSMRNGGGPACLRLRVVLDEAARAAVLPGAIPDEAGFQALETWVEKHYRDRLAPDDLADPELLDSARAALDELTELLGLGPVYDFQR